MGGYQRPDDRREDRPDRRLVENRPPGGRQVVTALRQRPLGQHQDRVFTTVTPGEAEAYAHDIVRRKVSRDAIMLSDEHAAYAGLNRMNIAYAIRHADRYAAEPGLNTNGVESFFVRVDGHWRAFIIALSERIWRSI